MENYKNDEFDHDKLEDQLKKEERGKRKIPMPVSGKGVFEIKRIKGERKNRKDKE